MSNELLQEKYWNEDPWRILVICCLLNRTQGVTAEPVIKQFFELWPTAERIGHVNEVHEVIAGLGLGSVRAFNICAMSHAYVNSMQQYRVVDPLLMPGCGRYAYEAWLMFVCKRRNFLPQDKKLLKRMKELIECENAQSTE